MRMHCREATPTAASATEPIRQFCESSLMRALHGTDRDTHGLRIQLPEVRFGKGIAATALGGEHAAFIITYRVRSKELEQRWTVHVYKRRYGENDTITTYGVQNERFECLISGFSVLPWSHMFADCRTTNLHACSYSTKLKRGQCSARASSSATPEKINRVRVATANNQRTQKTASAQKRLHVLPQALLQPQENDFQQAFCQQKCFRMTSNKHSVNRSVSENSFT
jgi:hypothetical protein